MEMPVCSWSGGAPSSRRHAGRAQLETSGVDRTKSRAAGGEAVPLELAVVEPRVLCDALGRRSLGRDRRRGGGGEISWMERKAESRVRVVEGRLASHAAAAAHAGET